jgi:hypothetical protein
MSVLHPLRMILWLLATAAAVPATAQPQSRLVTTELRSTSFAGSKIGISPDRRITVYLPQAYASGRKRFPVIYYLGHFFQDHAAPYSTDNAKALFDKAIGDGSIRDVIIVTADFSTPAGSSWYVNSSATGNWQDFMIRELVPHIDATYRTIPNRDSRGILGDAVGGYGAIRFGMQYPNIFGTVYAMNPVGTGINVQPPHSRPNWDLIQKAGSVEDLKSDGYSVIFTSIYQAFSPAPGKPPLFFDPPVRKTGDETLVDTKVLARLNAGFALSALLPAYAEQLKTLRGLKFDWGRADRLRDHIYGNQSFAHLLEEYGVPHEAEEHAGGFRDRHWGDTGRVYTDVLPFFDRHLVFADGTP